MTITKNYQERAKNKYRELFEEEKNIKREYGRNRYNSMSKENKKRLKEYQIKIIVRLENSFHNDKTHFKIAIAKILFVSFFINF